MEQKAYLQHLPFNGSLDAYDRQAATLLAAHRAGDPAAIELFHNRHPRFLDDKIKWLPKSIPDAEIRDADLTFEDARLAIARYYDFRDWQALAAYVESVSHDGPVREFESAVESVINGDLAALNAALNRNPGLVHQRSTRICCFDPTVHRATLLHYTAANGVEGYRQKSPPNSVEIARALLEAGAEPDALADMYGAKATTMGMLVSSSHPKEAGVQVPLVELLLDHGASVEALDTALAFGMIEAAKVLAKRGAKIDLPSAAGLGLKTETARLLPNADDHSRHLALALAAQHGHHEIVSMLLDSGEDPNRYNPKGNHPHSTPLHQAAVAGHIEVARVLLAHGASLEIRDKIWNGTPLGWALHASGNNDSAMVSYLRSVK